MPGALVVCPTPIGNLDDVTPRIREALISADLIGSRLGVACASFANIFEPEAIVIGGGVIAAGDLLLDPCRKEVRERALTPMNQTPILEATLGNDAGMIGAAALARTELEKQS